MRPVFGDLVTFIYFSYSYYIDLYYNAQIISYSYICSYYNYRYIFYWLYPYADIQCNNPANGKALCSSGRAGIGYEGDTCSFTCNTGYELTGSGTRTCQSDGIWSGTDDVCRKGDYIYI